MSSDYARWDDGWTRNPPEPPPRPGLYEWRYGLSEQDRLNYDQAVSGYLMAICDTRLWCYLTELRLDVLRQRIGGQHDGPPSRRLPWHGFQPRW